MTYELVQIRFLEEARKLLGRDFEIDQNNKLQVGLIIAWLAGDTEKMQGIGYHLCRDQAKHFTLSAEDQSYTPESFQFLPQKGLLLMGTVGTGKSLLMEIVKRMTAGTDRAFGRFVMFDIAGEFSKVGEDAFNTHKKGNRFYDEIGIKNYEVRNFYGSKLNVASLLILRRENALLQTGGMTHFTTNLSPAMLLAEYGLREFDRLRNICNFILLDGKSRRGRADSYQKTKQAEPEKPEKTARQMWLENTEMILAKARKIQEDGIWTEGPFDTYFHKIAYPQLDKAGIVAMTKDEKIELYKAEYEKLRQTIRFQSSGLVNDKSERTAFLNGKPEPDNRYLFDVTDKCKLIATRKTLKTVPLEILEEKLKAATPTE